MRFRFKTIKNKKPGSFTNINIWEREYRDCLQMYASLAGAVCCCGLIATAKHRLILLNLNHEKAA